MPKTLVFDNVDHGQFDLNWAEHGGILSVGGNCAKYLAPANHPASGVTKVFFYDLEDQVLDWCRIDYVRMATPAECDGKVRYIRRPDA